MFRSFALSLSLLPLAAWAEVPAVVTDIAPVHSLAARVMQGVGTPALIVRPGASPHEYSLTPAEAGALQNADVVFWVGPGLTPWFETRVEGLAPNALSIALLDLPETQVLPRREGALFEAHSHEDEAHEEHADHEGYEGHEGHEGHAAAGVDPHAWLDPLNASAWMVYMAEELARLDPEHADAYRANAVAGAAELTTLYSKIGADMAPLKGRKFLVFHDAYQYFEARFGLSAAGAINLSDATKASAARVADLRHAAEEGGITCAMSEPQFNDKLIDSVFGDLVKKGVLDPLGTPFEPGPDLYPQTLGAMAAAFTECLSQ